MLVSSLTWAPARDSIRNTKRKDEARLGDTHGTWCYSDAQACYRDLKADMDSRSTDPWLIADASRPWAPLCRLLAASQQSREDTGRRLPNAKP